MVGRGECNAVIEAVWIRTHCRLLEGCRMIQTWHWWQIMFLDTEVFSSDLVELVPEG